jgi:hypothetical protein
MSSEIHRLLSPERPTLGTSKRPIDAHKNPTRPSWIDWNMSDAVESAATVIRSEYQRKLQPWCRADPAAGSQRLEHPPLKLTRSRRGRNSFGIPVA